MAVPVVLVDRLGYASYRDPVGRPFLPADRFEVRLVTGLDRLAEAAGPELAAVIAVSRSDHRAFLDAARWLQQLGGRPATRIAAITERYLLPVAQLREELGLPGMTVAQTRRFRDKVAMKQHLRDSGIDIRLPEFAGYHPITARQLLARHGSIVAKPRLGAGAAGVYMLREEADLLRFEREQADQLEDFDVEQFIGGRVFHIDSVVDRGRVIAATAADSIDATNSYASQQYCRGIAVPDGELLDELLAFNAKVIAAHPDYFGVTHHEVFVAPDGLCFCEIAARTGGGGVLAGFRSRTGLNLDEVALTAQLLDRVPQHIEVAGHLTGYVLLYAGPGQLVRLPPVPTEDWVLEVQLLASPGQLLGPPADWGDAVAVATVRGDSPAEVQHRLDQLIERMLGELIVD
jgi:hypothetical protein